MWMKVLWSITAWDQFCKTLHIKYSVFVIWWDSRANVLALRRHLMRRSDSAKRLAGNRNCLTSTCGSVSLRLVRRTESGNFMPKNVCCSSALRVWSSRWNNTPSSQRTKLKKTLLWNWHSFWQNHSRLCAESVGSVQRAYFWINIFHYRQYNGKELVFFLSDTIFNLIFPPEVLAG